LIFNNLIFQKVKNPGNFFTNLNKKIRPKTAGQRFLGVGKAIACKAIKWLHGKQTKAGLKIGFSA
jgi:hypothetical protein